MDFRLQLYRFLSGYGMLLVLLLLCAYYSRVTWAEQHPTGATAGRQLAAALAQQAAPGTQVLIVARNTAEDVAFSSRLQRELTRAGIAIAASVNGEPADARRALQKVGEASGRVDFVACTAAAASWSLLQDLSEFPAAKGARVLQPRSYWWPNFLKADNF